MNEVKHFCCNHIPITKWCFSATYCHCSMNRVVKKSEQLFCLMEMNWTRIKQARRFVVLSSAKLIGKEHTDRRLQWDKSTWIRAPKMKRKQQREKSESEQAEINEAHGTHTHKHREQTNAEWGREWERNRLLHCCIFSLPTREYNHCAVAPLPLLHYRKHHNSFKIPRYISYRNCLGNLILL